MSAESLTTAAAVFTGPGIATNSTPAVNGSVGFHFVLDGTVQTLSTHNSPDDGPIKGLLFVPSLDTQDPCHDITGSLIPSNVTGYEDVSTLGYRTIGLAPWVSLECTKSFLSASRKAEIDALVFYQPYTNNTGKPPPSDDITWNLGDNSEWKNQNEYPVYAISGPAGATLMHQLSLYSSNMTQSREKSTYQGDIRLFTLIDLEQDGNKIPSLWGFILAILGTILVLSLILLVCYQLVQKRRRDNLQRRIEAGETDIEFLGLNQVKVPQEILDQIPVYTYPDLNAPAKAVLPDETRSITAGRISGEHTSLRSATSENKKNVQTDSYELKTLDTAITRSDPEINNNNDNNSNDSDSAPVHGQETFRLSNSQTTCAICLDDFEPRLSIVRELPCAHIFHAECIDTFLTQSSSLCPLCKKSVLPPGCYPRPITNLMVHRDHMLRRSR
ncbi:hypothetical protein ASPWEDRAFT_25413 [Aspergillus wentii DTO 134E9]|uniref:RING-type domain-containing protein n=1 Tax=Aspergillus wentii DTO 134E9 TaxID=1073089 RepID=A0A1L9RXC1_ASPWE|nr:uncharacterized protein ASPWEDRAFT_25413 [Aspergillus wentii DTO 134E9]KAI9931731.1 hypothetical protein MW887_010310 [Aspergillus wentii]OJJ39590.1 hypothetical protein ASPWEDRAFT_25413 [Aspergillus wentii DTO 134E9]